MLNVNDFRAETDSEILKKAFAQKNSDGIILIPPRKSEAEPERKVWIIDQAILLKENTTVIMLNSTIKLSDKCRDNFFRTANCGIGTEFPKKIRNVHIIGVGECRLVGADRPRATGDGGKILANPLPCDGNCEFSHSYGTDCGTSESQKGDCRRRISHGRFA